MIRRRTPQRGDVYWIDPNPTSGREMRDRHRFVVITPGEINVLGLVMTVPVTSGGMFARQTGLTVPIIGHDTQGVAVCNQVGIIVGAMSFTKNVYDGHTLPQVLEQAWQITETCPKVAICDRGYKGCQDVGDTKILRPGRPKKSDTPYQRRVARERFRRRAGIEPIIGHLKQDHRMARNYLKGVLGDAINLFMAAAAFNFKKWMRKLGHFFALFSLWLFCGTKCRQPYSMFFSGR